MIEVESKAAVAYPVLVYFIFHVSYNFGMLGTILIKHRLTCYAHRT